MSLIDVRTVTTEAEIRQVYRFRYAVYVGEMGRDPAYVDHAAKELRHPLDETAVNIAAFMSGTVVGVIRNNIGVDGDFGAYTQFYGIDSGDYDHPAHTSITSGLMVDARQRRGVIGARLAAASYEYGLQRKVRWNFIDCIPPLAPFFHGHGWIEYLPEAKHPEYPFVVKRLRLDLCDEAHLRSIRSPFFKILNKNNYLCDSDGLPADASVT